MGSVEFQEDNFNPYPRPEKQIGGLIGLLMRTGLAGDKKTAEMILLATFFLTLGGTGMLLLSGGDDDVRLPPPPPVYHDTTF